jgi:hypothetical protein
VTLEPEQIDVAEAVITTLAVKFELTVIVTTLDAAGFPVTQDALDVITHLILLLLARVVLV